MGQAKGSKTKIIFGTETTFKTLPSPITAIVLPFVSESLRQNRNLVESKTIKGTRNPSAPVRGNVDVAGDITMELQPYLGKLFKHVLGSLTTSGTASSISHVYKVGDLPAGMVIEKWFTSDLTASQYFRYMGCKVNSLKISVKPEGFIDAVVNIMGATETVSTSSMDSDASDLTAVGSYNPFDGFTASITRGGSSLGVATQVDLTIENALDGTVYVLDGTGTRYYLPEGMVKLTGTLTALFTDMSLYNLALNNTETSLVVTLSRGTGTGALGNEKLIITCDEIIFQPTAPVVSGPGGILIELPFVGYYSDGTNASALTFELVTPSEQV